jgi:hypothetical protein
MSESVSAETIPGGVVHELPADLREALVGGAEALDVWRDITPLARNEFICWGRPCCWPGCSHRERTGSA